MLRRADFRRRPSGRRCFWTFLTYQTIRHRNEKARKQRALLARGHAVDRQRHLWRRLRRRQQQPTPWSQHHEDGAITSAIYTDSRSEGEHDFRSSEASLSFKVALLFDLPTGSSTQPWPGFGRLWRYTLPFSDARSSGPISCSASTAVADLAKACRNFCGNASFCPNDATPSISTRIPTDR